jgi:predicted RNase H-like nuclease
VTHAVGVDAGAGGWVAVSLVEGRFSTAWFAEDLETLLAPVPALARVGIDIPLGGVAQGWRAVDLAAKRLLGPQHVKVFLAPPRPVWALADFTAANARCRELAGAGLSRQSFGLLARMLAAEAVERPLFEVHPELVFLSLHGGLLPYGKKSWNGQFTRRGLLAGVGVVLPDQLSGIGSVPADDVLDAAAVAWCAHRIALGLACRVPADQHDVGGRPIEIWMP